MVGVGVCCYPERLSRCTWFIVALRGSGQLLIFLQSAQFHTSLGSQISQMILSSCSHTVAGLRAVCVLTHRHGTYCVLLDTCTVPLHALSRHIHTSRPTGCTQTLGTTCYNISSFPSRLRCLTLSTETWDARVLGLTEYSAQRVCMSFWLVVIVLLKHSNVWHIF